MHRKRIIMWVCAGFDVGKLGACAGRFTVCCLGLVRAGRDGTCAFNHQIRSNRVCRSGLHEADPDIIVVLGIDSFGPARLVIRPESNPHALCNRNWLEPTKIKMLRRRRRCLACLFFSQDNIPELRASKGPFSHSARDPPPPKQKVGFQLLHRYL